MQLCWGDNVDALPLRRANAFYNVSNGGSSTHSLKEANEMASNPALLDGLWRFDSHGLADSWTMGERKASNAQSDDVSSLLGI